VKGIKVIKGDALCLPLEDTSIDAIVTDPPYGLDFMGKAWDKFTPTDFQEWCQLWALEAYRVLKPGGYM
jgi:site-specific DNA-methyltransferase (adenine-specific)